MKKFNFYILIFLAILLSEHAFAQNQFLSKDVNNPLELSYTDGSDFYSIKTNAGECNSLSIPGCSRFYNPNNNFFSFLMNEFGGVDINLLMRDITAGGISLFVNENGQLREIYCTDFNTDNLNIKFLNEIYAGKLVTAQLWFLNDETSIKSKLLIKSYSGNGQKVPVIDVSGYDAAQLITEVLVSGCVEASNVTFSGNPLSIGYFENGVPGLDFESGVIISTGRASAAAGPNTSNSTGYFMNTPGDADLNALTGMTTFDASIIEFDFVPASDVITFEYVFGSEEYEEFVGMNLNDAFAFFVSGGPEGYVNENVAIIPGVGDPVTINNINSTTNSAYYINNIGGAHLQYDGLTVTLTATIDVTECESYHIKLAIADVGDVLYDSGVFLKAGSFSSGSNVAIRTYNEWGLDDEVYEGCVNDITFSRTDLTTLDEDMPVILTIGGTATNGTDYSTLNTNYTIPAGEESITIPMEAYLDGLTEGSETVILTVFNGCPCDIETYTDTLYILDPLIFTSSLTNNGPICEGNPATLTVNMNPIPDTVRIEWSTGVIGPSQITVTPAVTTTYTAMIYYPCDSVEVTTTVVVNPAPDATASNDGPYCVGDDIHLSATGGGTYRWRGPSGFLTLVQNPTITNAQLNNGGTYQVTVTGANGCRTIESTFVEIYPLPDMELDANTPFCEEDPISFIIDTFPDYFYWGPNSWNSVDSFPIVGPAAENLEGWYYCIVTDTNMCRTIDSVFIEVNPKPVASGSSNSPVCEGEDITLFGNGGPTYGWTGPSGFTSADQNPIIVAATASQGGNYVLTVTNIFNCTDTHTENVVVIPEPDASFTNPGPICYDEPDVNIVPTNPGGTWSGTGIVDPVNGTFSPSTAGIGTHTITYTYDDGSCIGIYSDDVVVDTIPDIDLTPSGPYCVSDPSAFLATTTPGGTWSGTGIIDPATGEFDPNTAGVGTHTISYTLSTGSCFGIETMPITVTGAADATITPAGPFCENETATTLSAVTPGGTWSGTGITDPATGEFTPSTAGVGTHTITYTAGIGSCADTDTEDFTVDAYPDSDWTAVGPFCESDPSVNLISVNLGGTWSGNGITDPVNGVFDPATAGGGDHNITYTLINGACTSPTTYQIHVDTEVDATITPDGPFCENDAPIILTAVSAGGTWSGTGITNMATGEFTPSIAGVGTFTITYDIINGQCSDTDTEDFTVDSYPDSDWTPQGPFCESDASVNLLSVNPGGTWSGNGITDPVNGVFDPATAGGGDHNITYTLINGACTSPTTYQIHVDDEVDATITPDGPFCENDAPIILTAVSVGGTWSGTGVTNAATGEFTPSVAGVGTYTITYDIINGQCSDTDTEDFTVDSYPDSDWTPVGPFCESDASVILSSVNPGGTWSGTGITDPVNGIFDPATAGGGNHNITYTIINGACTSPTTYQIHVDAEVDATITPAGPFCETQVSSVLTAASPGGTWSGTGIVNPATGLFSPSGAGPGTYVITYDIINGLCSDTDTENITVNSNPDSDWTPQGPFCENQASVILIPVTFGGTWSGTGITDAVNGIFDPATAGGGDHNISYTIVNGACNSVTTYPIHVDSDVDATITPAGPFCETDAATNLIAASAGGTWSGTGIVNPVTGLFSPVTAGVGTFVITYNIVNGLCSDSDTENITVDASPDSDWTLQGPFCETDAAVILNSINPGGTWSGTGITDPVNGIFDPTIAGGGNHNITYTIISGACNSTTTYQIHVDNDVDATITPAGPFCETQLSVNLTAAMAGGTWSGTGITNPATGQFSPSTAGPGLYVITYNIVNGQCSDSDTENVTVSSYPDSDWTPQGPFCENDAAVNLNALTAGGTWSGTGITDALAGTFDPTIATSGVHNITYTLINGACTSATTYPITVNPVVDAQINPSGPYCETSPAVTLTATNPGGTWSGTGITNPATGLFNPVVANPGIHTITYTIINGGCTDSDTEDFIVDVYPDSDWANIGPFCENDASVNIVPVTAGGTFSGTGITDPILGTFNPVTAGVGTHNVTYTVINGACTSQTTQPVIVSSDVDATISPAGPFCETDGIINLLAADPGGTWSGTGIINPVTGSFDPTVAGVGVHTITYNISNGSCSDSDTESITVNPAPDAEFTPAGPFCENDASVNLIPNNPGGTWSGTGITDPVNGTFSPIAAGAGLHNITYTITIGSCVDAVTHQIQVFDDVDATITPAGPFCQTQAALNLSAATPGGTWSGTGITNPATGTFNPAIAGPGVHTITYIVGNGSCTDTDTETITVNFYPNSSITPAGPFCETDAAVNLSAASPGGTWSGTGITNPATGLFNPSTAGGGSHLISYSITNGACVSTSNTSIQVYDFYDATITPVALVCIFDPAFNLTAASVGGTWSGTGITNALLGTFDPTLAGAGTHTITYSITNGTCSDTDTEDITVSASPDATITPEGPFCQSDASVILTSADAGGTWSGNGIVDAISGEFDPNIAGGGDHVITYTIIAGACTSIDTETIHVDAGVDATITPAGPFCQFDAAVNLTAVSAGGTWAGTGITDAVNGTFTPSTAGPGTHNITYNIVSGLCSDSDNINIVVNPAPDGTITDPGPFCVTDPATTLIAATVGGTWAGTGITNPITGVFDPSVALIGENVITYTISNAFCTTIATISVYVYDAVVDATITNSGIYCVSQGLVPLTAVTPGGTWSGTGVAGTDFDPSAAGPGNHLITYNVGNAGCSDSDSYLFHVDDTLSAIITPAGPVCEDAAAFNLNAANVGGIWSGTGITNIALGTFNPGIAGDGNHLITYTITQGACTNVDNIIIQVDALVDATITPAGPFCNNEPIQTLTAASPGGIWAGTGIVNAASGLFHPTVAGGGDHLITYTVVNGMCSDSDTETIHVDIFQNSTISPAGPFCEADPVYNLSALTAGGTWSGDGITDPVNGVFDPSAAGGGVHIITYQIVNGACTSTSTINISVDDFYDATISPAGPFCNTDPAQTLTAASTGGIWAGTGITDPANGTFHPGISGFGDFVITYTTSNGLCNDSDNITVHVDEYQDPTITPVPTICESSVAFNLTAASPGGLWSGNGITDAVAGTFDPSVAGDGTHIITYDIINGGCSSSDTETIDVDDSPDVTITPVGPFCETDAVTTLTAATPGGTWSGTGITNPITGSFNPGAALAGSHVITYQLVNGTCTAIDTETFVVDAYPNTTLAAYGPYCEADAPIDLVEPSLGGTWSGIGITDNILGIFDPSIAGFGIHTITYNVINGACNSSGTTDISVDEYLSANINPAGPFCLMDGSVFLTAATPGGTWSGNGIINPVTGLFNPNDAGVGSHIITYQVINASCTATDTETIQVDDYPNTTLASYGPYCETDASVDLVEPSAGGTWTGDGITDAVNGIFDPITAGYGTHTITYTVINGVCTSVGTTDIQVDQFLSATIDPAGPFCSIDAVVTLTAASAGGTWSGTGITDAVNGVFDPVVAMAGSHIITYQITNGMCSDSDTETIQVDDYPNTTLASYGPYCEADASVDLVEPSAGGTWTGDGITDAVNGIFDPVTAGFGTHTITYTVINGVCTSVGTTDIQVDQFLSATIDPAGPFCSIDAAVTITAASAGGTWSGTGITDAVNGVFDPVVAMAGSHIITYQITNGMCSDSDTETIQVDDYPNTTLASYGPYCEADASVDLVEPSPGGTWTGDGITDAVNGIFDPVTAGFGTHTITYTVINGVCTSVGTTDIQVDQFLSATIDPAGPFCSIDAAVTLTAASIGGTWSGTGITDAVNGIFDPVVAMAGVHNIQYTITNGMCSDTDDIDITVEQAPDPTITSLGPVCETSGIQLLTAVDPGGIWTGNGTDAAGNFDPAAAGPGTHEIIYTINIGACLTADTIYMQVDEFFDAEITDAGVYCFMDDPIQLTALNDMGTWSGNGVDVDGLFSPSVAGVGNHLITHEIINGTCSDTDDITIIVNPNPDATITDVLPICIDNPPFDFIAATAGGTWSGTGITDILLGTFDPATSGDGTFTIYYSVTVTGCTSVDSSEIIVNPLPVVTITGLDSEYCLNEPAVELTLSPAGGILSGTGVNGTSFDPVLAGVGTFTLTYTFTDTNSCTNSAMVDVTVHGLPVVSISGIDSMYCLYDVDVYPVLLPAGGTFEGAGVTDTIFNPFAAGPGDHSLIYYYTDINSCTDTAEVNTTVLSRVSIEYTHVEPSCFGYTDGSISTTVTGGLAPYEYNWSAPGNPTNPDITDVAAGWYYITVTDDFDCVYSDSTELLQPDQLVASITGQLFVSCNGYTDAFVNVEAVGGTPLYSYLWDDDTNSEDSTLNDLPPGIYNVTITDSHSCTTTAQVDITEPDPLTLTFIDIVDVACYGDSTGSVSVEINGGTEPYNVVWDDPAETEGLTASNLPAWFYTVEVTDHRGCTLSDIVEIEQSDSIYVESIITPVICNQQMGAIEITPHGGEGPYHYEWENGDTLSVVSGMPSGPIGLTMTDSFGCSYETIIEIPNIGIISVEIEQTEIIRCFGDTTGALLVSPLNAAGNCEYSWSTGDSVPEIFNLRPGTYYATVIDEWGCQGSDTFELTQPNLLTLDITHADVLCMGENTGSATVIPSGGTGPFDAVWQWGGNGLTNNNLPVGTTWVTVTDDLGCNDSISVLIGEPSSLVSVSVNVRQITCYGAQDGYINGVASGGTPPYVYTWYINGISMTEATIRNLGPGNYTLIVTDRNGCEASTTVVLENPLPISAAFITGNPSCDGNHDGYIQMAASGGIPPYEFLMYGEFPESYIIDSLYEGEYFVEVRDSNNCQYIAGPIVLIDNAIDCLHFPVAFSPNGDGYNDEWFIENLHLYPRAVIQIYNRWGQLLYEKLGTEGFWDGTYNGDPVPTGSYIYCIILNINEENRVGTVTVVR